MRRSNNTLIFSNTLQETVLQGMTSRVVIAGPHSLCFSSDHTNCVDHASKFGKWLQDYLEMDCESIYHDLALPETTLKAKLDRIQAFTDEVLDITSNNASFLVVVDSFVPSWHMFDDLPDDCPVVVFSRHDRLRKSILTSIPASISLPKSADQIWIATQKCKNYESVAIELSDKLTDDELKTFAEKLAVVIRDFLKPPPVVEPPPLKKQKIVKSKKSVAFADEE
jgi:hypothetical protein